MANFFWFSDTQWARIEPTRGNFDEKAIQILELTQTTILSALHNLINSEEWGDPRGYVGSVAYSGNPVSVVPEPASAAMLSLGLLALAAAVRPRRERPRE